MGDCTSPFPLPYSPPQLLLIKAHTTDRMGKQNKAHRFCPTCSSSLLIDWQHSDVPSQRPYLAMNARLFEGVD